MQKHTSSKNRNTNSVRTRARKAAPSAKKKRLNAKRQKTVLAKLKNALDETAAKLRTLLPGETKKTEGDANEMA